MKKSKRERQEGAIKRMEAAIASHQQDATLVKRILEDKELTKTSDEIEKIRKKKIERHEVAIKNTKNKMRNHDHTKFKCLFAFKAFGFKD